MDTPGKKRRAFIVNGLKTSAAALLVPSGLTQLLHIPPSLFSEPPWADAIACWQLGDLADTRGKFPLKPMRKGVEFIKSPATRAPKAKSGNDSLARFNGEGWVELRNPSDLTLNPGALTLATKIFPTKGGGLIQHGLVSLVLHPSGMVVAILQVEDATGAMFRNTCRIICFSEDLPAR